MKANPWTAEVREGALTATFCGDGRMPQCAPDPNYPDGKDVDLTAGAAAVCAVQLHQAPCCGAWAIACSLCGYTAVVTAAGRADDPRVVRLPCKIGGRA